MSLEKIKCIQSNFKLLNAIRRLHTGDKSEIASAAGQSWPTVSKAIESLKQKDKVITLDDNQYTVKDNYAYFAGISVGKDIKVAFCDFGLNPLKVDEGYKIAGIAELAEKLKNEVKLPVHTNDCSFCYNPSSDLADIRQTINKIVQLIMDEHQKGNFPLLGIGISFPGIIDYNTKAFVFNPNIKTLTNFYIDKMLEDSLKDRIEEAGISVYYEHDSASAVIYEKETLYNPDNKYYELRNKKNVGCIYLGTGIGLGIILNDTLMRGGSNAIGELGHITKPTTEVAIKSMIHKDNPTPDDILRNAQIEKEMADKEDYYHYSPDLQNPHPHREPLLCDCGKKDCLENNLRIDVFDAYELDDYHDKTTPEQLADFKENHPYRYKVLIAYLSNVLNLLINLYNFEIIIFSGRIINQIEGIEESLQSLQYGSAIRFSSSNCISITGTKNIASVAIGAAIAAYFKVGTPDTTDPIQVCW